MNQQRYHKAPQGRPHSRKRKQTARPVLIALLLVGAIIAACFFVTYHVIAMHTPTSDTATNATTTPAGPDAYAHVSLIAKSAIVYDLSDGDTLYAQNADAQLPLASITKLLTLYAGSETLSPDSPVTMSATAATLDQDAADMGFTAGETFRYEDLARMTLAASSNAGAEAIAEATAQARSQDISDMLGSVANQLGLKQTHALNGSGLDINTQVSGGYGSAHDIAVLAGALLERYPDIVEASTLPVISATSQQGITHTFPNTDINVTHIPDLLLSKTGYTDLAGGNLVVVYDAGIDHPIAIVVLGSTENGRFTDVAQLLAATQAHFANIMPPAVVPMTTPSNV